MKKENGFTIVELLIVLSLFSLLLVIGASFQTKSYQAYQFNCWYQQFESDVLFIQQQTLVSRENIYLLINPNSHTYEIRRGGLGEIITVRSFPDNWEIKLNTLSMPLSFSINGTLRNPGMFQVLTKGMAYDIYFPFGKGRSYFIEK